MDSFTEYSVEKTTAPAAPYTRRAPSPPQITMPLIHQIRCSRAGQVQIATTYENVDPSELTPEDLAIITRNQTQLIASSTSGSWKYEERRKAQRILDFLYVGPNSAIRDHKFLQEEAITMLIMVRDSRLASRGLRSVEEASHTLGIRYACLDVESGQNPIRHFPEMVRLINNHLLEVYRSAGTDMPPEQRGIPDPAEFRRGKVLLTCDSGNDLSPSIATAYIMSIFGMDMTDALRFVSVQRFCVSLSDDMKRHLQTWQDILRARTSVARARTPVPGQPPEEAPKAKRNVDNLRGEDDPDGMDMEYHTSSMDGERFTGRAAFVPFVDLAKDGCPTGENGSMG